MASKPTSKLDALVDEAVTVLQKLEKLNGNRKLCFKSFLDEALEIAEIDEKRLDVVEKIVAEKHGVEHVQAFLRRYSKAISESNYPSPGRDPSRMTRIFGSEELAGQMGQYQIVSGELQALAVKMCHARYGDTAFGVVQDRIKHERETTASRQRLEEVHAEMKVAFTGADISIDTESLLPDERTRGLCLVGFIRCPSVGPSTPEWPSKLILDAVGKKPKPKPARERLAGKKAA